MESGSVKKGALALRGRKEERKEQRNGKRKEQRKYKMALQMGRGTKEFVKKGQREGGN